MRRLNAGADARRNRIPRAVGQLTLLLGVVMLVVGCSKAFAQGGPGAMADSIGWRDVMVCLCGVITALVGLWHRRLDRDITENRAAIAKEQTRSHAIELRIVQLEVRAGIAPRHSPS